VAVAGVVLLLAGCSGQADQTGTTPPTTVSSTSTEPPTEPESSTTLSQPTSDSVPDYAVLIATVEAAMEETAYDGAALEDVEVFIATAELFCDLLDEGMTTDELLADYLDRISDGGTVEVDEDDGLMAGVLLGAAIEVVCPEHSEG
jgi:hypothetical protein